MKRVIRTNDDWRTDTADDRINAFRQIMADNKELQDDPEVGIFWYDTKNHELFGIREALAEDVPFKYTSLFSSRARTCTPLHEQVWRKEHFRGADSRFNGDYTKIPRGRVFEVEDQGFVICVGSWINDYPEAVDIIIDRFELPEDSEILIDSHWELGHGWS